MATLESYQICVPSRGRAYRMPNLLQSFPTAHIYCSEKDAPEYLKHVPPEQLRIHEGLHGKQRVCNRMLDTESAECLFIMDDDFEWVKVMVCMYPSYMVHYYTEWPALRAIIENGVNILCDLGQPWYAWSNCAHPGAYSNNSPCSLTGICAGAYIIRGRQYRWDEETEHDDLDMTLQVLLRDRYLVKDQRFYWSFGKTTGNPGGCQEIDTKESWARDIEYMKQKWPGYVHISTASGNANLNGHKTGQSQGFSHRVNRKNHLVAKGSGNDGSWE